MSQNSVKSRSVKVIWKMHKEGIGAGLSGRQFVEEKDGKVERELCVVPCSFTPVIPFEGQNACQ